MSEEHGLEIEFQAGDYIVRVRGHNIEDTLAMAKDVERLLGRKVERRREPSQRETGADPAQFIKSKNPKTDLDKTMCACYFLAKHRNTTSITKKDLDEFFPEARMQMPTNMNDMLNKNVERGYLAPTGKVKEGRKSYYVTTEGEQFVENNLRDSTSG
jgi:hypothetical protein